MRKIYNILTTMDRALPWVKKTRLEREGWRTLKKPCYGDSEETEERFHNFEVTDHPPEDHRFITNKNDTDSTMQKITMEWKTLEEEVAGTCVYVRAYRSRPDLMRAVIIGSDHGLFFFDILIPSNYPLRPPKACYLNHGIEVNRNVSFEKSSILELLVSIQSSVSIEKLEPDFIGLCESVLNLLGEPPMGFGDFVRGHFRKRADSILTMYEDIVDTQDQLFWSLVIGFGSTGAYCDNHYTMSQLMESLEARRKETIDDIIADSTSKGLVILFCSSESGLGV